MQKTRCSKQFEILRRGWEGRMLHSFNPLGIHCCMQHEIWKIMLSLVKENAATELHC